MFVSVFDKRIVKPNTLSLKLLSAMSAIILHLETATEVCSICLSSRTEILAMEESHEGYVHSKMITVMIKSVMDKAGKSFGDLDAISISQGPGSYTSLRVGASAAKALCYTLDLPMIAVDTLGSLARAAIEKASLPAPAYSIPLIDARRMEVYTAVFDTDHQVVQATQAKIIDADAFRYLSSEDHKLLFCGNGLEKCKVYLQHPQMLFSDVVCTATNLVQPALQAYENNQFADTAYFSPYYFKAPNITKRRKKVL